MKKCRVFFLIIIVFLLGACFPPNDYSPYEQIIDYIPQKAGAEVVKTLEFINRKRCSSLYYQNNQICAIHNEISTDEIIFFDITNDEVIKKRTLRINKTTIMNQYTYINTECVNNINEDIFILAEVTDNSTDEQLFVLLIYDESNDSFAFYDNSSDFEDRTNICRMYFNDNKECFTVSDYCNYYNKSIKCYKFNENEYRFEKKNTINFDKPGYIFFSNKYLFFNHYYPPNFGDTTNFLYIYQINSDYSLTEVKKINLIFLNRRSGLLSVFTDNNDNIWIYEYIYDSDYKIYKHKFHQLKLLDTEASDNEFIKHDCY